MTASPKPGDDKTKKKQGPHRWRKGESGNPSGMRKGTKHKFSRRLFDLVKTNAVEIVQGIIKDAKEGDADARKLFLRLLPQMPRNTEPIDVVRPESIEQIRQLAGDLVVQVLSGDLDLETAKTAAGLLQSQNTAIASTDLAAALEEIRKSRGVKK
jgi:hypothetical protein